MRRVVLALLFCIPALASQAAPTVAGRWEGRVEIPGREMPIVVDLAPDASGAWSGSIVIPGLDVKGAPLGNIVVTGAAVRFDIGDALGAAPNRAAFEARLNGDGRMVGKMLQAGNVARFALQKTGPAQVEFPRRSTPVAPELEGQWSGDYELAAMRAMSPSTFTIMPVPRPAQSSWSSASKPPTSRSTSSPRREIC